MGVRIPPVLPVFMTRNERVKIQAVKCKGGKCLVCGYDKCIKALHFHHIDPATKEFSISNTYSFSEEKINHELSKCVLVCNRCHTEIHCGLIDLSSYLGYEVAKPIVITNNRCYKTGPQLNKRKFNPSKEELEKLMKETTMVNIGIIYKVSDSAVRKRLKLLGIKPKRSK